jgi:hypothetical protein
MDLAHPLVVWRWIIRPNLVILGVCRDGTDSHREAVTSVFGLLIRQRRRAFGQKACTRRGPRLCCERMHHLTGIGVCEQLGRTTSSNSAAPFGNPNAEHGEEKENTANDTQGNGYRLGLS